jgi:undecaprenyl-diphosphatase
MDIVIAATYGLVQGLTEFLPISSSGHLVILHEVLPLNIANELAFDVFLHLATALAVIIYFWRDIWQFMALKQNKLAALIGLATIPAALAGFLFEDYIETIFRSVYVVVVMLAVVGIVFIVVEKITRRQKDISGIKWYDSLFIGLAQALALIPGTSRSGITIAAGLWLGLKRTQALKFSFLMSVPIILGANAKKLLSLENAVMADEFSVYLFGALSAFIFGWLAIKYFLRLARRRGLEVFAYYRFALAAILAIWLMF